MMDAQTIRHLAQQQARRAARAKSLPLVIEGEDMPNDARLFEYVRHMPNIGTYLPRGWKLIDHQLVDKTGWGREDEPALTIRGLLSWVRSAGPGFGFAIIEESQFQILVGRFQSTRGRKS